MKKLLLIAIMLISTLTISQADEKKVQNKGFKSVLNSQEINFSDTQKEEIKKLLKENREKDKAVRANIKKLNADNKDLFTSKNFNEEKVVSYNKQIHTEMGKLMDNRLNLMLAIMKIADDKQKEALIPMLKNKLTPMGDRHKKPNKDKNKKDKKN